MLRVFFVILTFLLFPYCSTIKKITTEEIIGKYEWYAIYGVGSTIQLNEDNTFEYNWQYGVSYGTTKGTWRLEGKRIILNSEHQPRKRGEKIYRLTHTDSENSDSIIVEVFFTYTYSDHSVEPAPFTPCILKSDNAVLFEKETDFYGFVKLPRIGADSLIIDCFGPRIVRHELDSSVTHYVFEIFEDLKVWNYQFFTDEVWRFKKGRLYDPSIKKNQYVKNFYERIK